MSELNLQRERCVVQTNTGTEKFVDLSFLFSYNLNESSEKGHYCSAQLIFTLE
jgi:hypothetical protein